MTSETIEKKKPEKFLFGTHNFDEPDEDDLDADPPPPTYSQEELDAATRDAWHPLEALAGNAPCRFSAS